MYFLTKFCVQFGAFSYNKYHFFMTKCSPMKYQCILSQINVTNVSVVGPFDIKLLMQGRETVVCPNCFKSCCLINVKGMKSLKLVLAFESVPHVTLNVLSWPGWALVVVISLQTVTFGSYRACVSVGSCVSYISAPQTGHKVMKY